MMSIRNWKKIIVFLIILGVNLPLISDSHPYQIIVFRHAEKVEMKREHDAPLSHEGQRRAAYLVNFLLNPQIIDQEKYEIAGVFTPNPYGNLYGEAYYYVRPTQTIIPLFHQAQFYRIGKSGKEVIFSDGVHFNEPEDLFGQILGKKEFEGKTVVVCWEHVYIPKLFDKYFNNLKKDFPHLGEDRYDMVWVIRWEKDTPKALTFYQEAKL